MAASGKRWTAGAEVAEDMGECSNSRRRGLEPGSAAEQFLHKFTL
jgi:hypothetical protein